MGESTFGVLVVDGKARKSSEVIRFEKAEGHELRHQINHRDGC